MTNFKISRALHKVAIRVPALLWLLGVLVITDNAHATCSPNAISGKVDAATLRITEYAVVRNLGPANCPSPEDRLGSIISLPSKGHLFIWFRLEGDELYLRSAAAKGKFRARLLRQGDDTTSNYLLKIFNDGLDIKKVAVEAANNEPKNFDWRFHVYFKTPTRPGTYNLALFQGSHPICTNAPDVCSVTIRIE